MVSHGNGGQQVLYVIGTYQMGIHGIPVGEIAEKGILYAPAEGEERLAADHFSLDADIHIVALSVEDHLLGLPVTCHLHQVLVIRINKNRYDRMTVLVVGLDEVVIEFTLRLLHALKRTEALQVSAAHTGDQSAGRLCRLNEGLDVAGVGGPHLYHGNLMFFL